MNIHDLRESQARFVMKIPEILESRKNLYKVRDSFVRYYTPKRINEMPLDHYAIGNYLPKRGYNFCYTLERNLDGLGRIIGATSIKFGIYYGKVRSDQTDKYRFSKKFGTTKDAAYEQVKKSIIELITAGKKEDIKTIINNRFSPMFKGKILSTYFPDKYLNIFSDEHLEYFLMKLNLDTEELIWSDAVVKRDALVEFKNNDSEMKNWSLDIFSSFLYETFGRPARENETSDKRKGVLNDYRTPDFPTIIKPEWIEMNIEEPNSVPPKAKTKPKSNPDYEKEARKLKKYGDRGEKIVLDMELDKLSKKPNLAKKVKKAKYDYLGYDIKSYEENGTPIYIEVKATTSKVGSANFYLSANELEKAKELPNYKIYMVFDILSTKPKVWVIPNPFKPKNNKVSMIATSYKVTINASKK